MILVIRYFIAFIIVFISIPAYAGQMTGKVKIVTSYNKKAGNHQYLDFSKKGNKIRIDTNEDIYYIIDVGNDSVWIINPEFRTASKSKAQNMINRSRFPLLVFQSPDKLKSYIKKSVPNKSSIKDEIKEEYEIISFDLSGTHFKITYSKNLNIPISANIINSESSLNINIPENKIKMVPDKDQIFVIPKEYKIFDYSNENFF